MAAVFNWPSWPLHYSSDDSDISSRVDKFFSLLEDVDDECFQSFKGIAHFARCYFHMSEGLEAAKAESSTWASYGMSFISPTKDGMEIQKLMNKLLERFAGAQLSPGITLYVHFKDSLLGGQHAKDGRHIDQSQMEKLLKEVEVFARDAIFHLAENSESENVSAFQFKHLGEPFIKATGSYIRQRFSFLLYKDLGVNEQDVLRALYLIIQSENPIDTELFTLGGYKVTSRQV